MNNNSPAAAQVGAETHPSSPGTQSVTDYDNGVSAIDADYLRPGLAAIHLIRENGQAALVDTGTSSSVAGVMNALREKNLGARGCGLRVPHPHTSGPCRRRG